jgi:SEC-C motif-containing protein
VKLAPNTLCPCGSTKKAKRCCGPLLDGQAAPTAEALMRSRYVAYSLGDVAYVQHTTHSRSPHREADLAAWTARLRQFCEETTFVGLRVLSAETAGEQATVRFWASLKRGADDVSFGEESRFAREGGRWVYLVGRPLPPPQERRSP